MRVITDERGRVWKATVRESGGKDYKGRYYFVALPEGAAESEAVALEDIRWNSQRTAARTLETMSEVELLRRLRSARGRSGAPTGPGAPAADAAAVRGS